MSEEAILIHSDWFWEIRKLKRIGDLLVDKMSGKIYTAKANKISIKKGKRKKDYYLIDPEKGVALNLEILRELKNGKPLNQVNSVRIEKDETIMKLKTNPELVYQAIEGGLLLKLLKIKPTIGQIVAGIILGLVIGIIVGGILF